MSIKSHCPSQNSPEKKCDSNSIITAYWPSKNAFSCILLYSIFYDTLIIFNVIAVIVFFFVLLMLGRISVFVRYFFIYLLLCIIFSYCALNSCFVVVKKKIKLFVLKMCKYLPQSFFFLDDKNYLLWLILLSLAWDYCRTQSF